jgi:DNA-binding transcriptional LysR family regulator
MMNPIQLSRIDLNLLVLFEAVFTTRHVGRAAEALNLSPSAVSHSLTRLRRLLSDPLFLKVPKGVVPTAKAEFLAAQIGEILAQVRNVVAMTETFDPKNTRRRFVIGAIPGTAIVILSHLVERLRGAAPGIDLTIRDTTEGTTFGELDDRVIDVALTHLDNIPARFDARPLYSEKFVVVMRVGHPLASDMCLSAFTRAGFVLVAPNGEPRGFVDDALMNLGMSRRNVVVTTEFLTALKLVADSDLIAVFPERLAILYAHRFEIMVQEPPIPLRQFKIRVVTPKPALDDGGVLWLIQMIQAVSRGPNGPAGNVLFDRVRQVEPAGGV